MNSAHAAATDPAALPLVDTPHSGRQHPGAHLSGSHLRFGQKSADSCLIQPVAISDLRLRNLQTSLRSGVTKKFEGAFDGFKVLRCHEHNICPAVLCNLHTLVRRGDPIDDLR